MSLDKKQKFIDLILIFFTFSFFGWFWELIYDLLNTGNLANHGVLLGPWLPIYGCGAIVIYLLFNRYRNNSLVVFMGAFDFCTVMEYCTGWYLETYKHNSWWTYYDMPFNIDGRICLLSSIFFGLLGVVGVDYIIPRLKELFHKFDLKKISIICLLLTSLFIIDFIHSFYHPNIVKKHKVIDTSEIRLFKK